MTPDQTKALLAGKPWAGVADDQIAPALQVPSMLSLRERKLYHWLARHWATGRGAIVDLGCFVGGSTASLAQGVRSRAAMQEIHAYDRFHADQRAKERYLYPADVPPFEGSDMVHAASSFLRPWQDLITLHPGRIEEEGWQGGPIELLIIDAAKSASVADRIAEAFYPHLIPGHSLIVHQDILHWKVPWIAHQMAHLSDSLPALGHCPPDALIFGCDTLPDAHVLAKARVTGQSDAVIQDGIAALRAQTGAWNVENKLDVLAASLRANPLARMAKDFQTKGTP